MTKFLTFGQVKLISCLCCYLRYYILLCLLFQGHWEPSVCMNFCAQFLDFVKTCLNGAKNSVWIFNFNPGEPISARDLGSDQSYDFFPEWLKKV